MTDPDEKTRAAHAALPSEPPELVPARMINEALYCERLMYLEWAQGEFAHNRFTVEGKAVHRRVDRPGGKLPERAEDREAAGADAGAAPAKARSVWVSSERLGMTAKADYVEEGEGGAVVVVEYKRGRRPDVKEGAYLPERAQLCAQVLLLRDSGYDCREAAIYYAEEHTRVAIAIDDALVAATLQAARRAREITRSGVMPPPLVDSPKCRGCSLVGICLPDEVNALAGGRERRGHAGDDGDDEEDDARAPGRDAPEPPALRRLQAARDDRLPLYVQDQGAYVGLEGECLRVRSRGGEERKVKLYNTSQVSLFGNVQVTTQALKTLLRRDVPVSFFSTGGWFIGRAIASSSNNVELRVAQYAAAGKPAFRLSVARRIVRTKIRNARTLLRRNAAGVPEQALDNLRGLARKAMKAASLPELLGIEGTAARAYFADFTGMLKGEADLGVFALAGRNRRPPRDPINALLSFCYAMLVKDVTFALAAAGLDPMLGFYHEPRFGRPALALDLMEEFRPIIADSVVIGAVNNGVVREGDFVITPVGVSIKPPGRKRLIQAYERRMDHLVTHPLFGYRVSYRRILEIQARLLGRLLLGEIDEYPAFETR